MSEKSIIQASYPELTEEECEEWMSEDAGLLAALNSARRRNKELLKSNARLKMRLERIRSTREFLT